MNGIDYEKACARYLARHGYHRIRMTPATGDQGIDLLAVRSHQLYGFQCKYYSRPVGNKAVQQAYAGKTYYGCDCCGVITNNTFTPSAKQLAEAADVILLDQIEPLKIDLLAYLLNAASFVLFCIAAGKLLETNSNGASGADIISSFRAFTMLFAAAFSPFSENHYYAALSASLLYICSLGASFVLMTLYSSLSLLMVTAFSAAIAVAVGIRLIRLIRERTAKYTEDMTLQLQEEFTETLKSTGIRFGQLLSRDLETDLELLSYTHTIDGISEFVYQSKEDRSDSLLTEEAMLNHSASQEGLEESYELIPQDEHHFLARICIRDL